MPGSGRLKKADWLDLGLALLAESGPDALTIETACQRAKRSKGSFYHHFETIDAYLLAMAGAWRERHTEAVMRQVEKAGTAEEKLEALNIATSLLDQRIDQAMRSLATRHPGIAEICAWVDRHRTGFLARLHEAAGLPPETARVLARIEYAAFLGLSILEPASTPAERQALYRHFLALLKR
ncbi:TetR/AcrR family transcriptional regulator [Rhabdaerophilum sp. SD176]|uniref:TetR/AcrR family transcriptional regulator n=1 Tax=Rhabdaerophilum sp. SD176 TaxID=2983548 RepID=UPI0024E02993|nr:TetR/AcrR family transcriptional regulator [Rhabdaerophilum sp. SD176]